MGQALHGSAKTTHAIRGELQRSQASVAHLARKYGINEKTVLKWRKRQSIEDMPMGPKERRSTVLSPMEDAAIVALLVQARLPLDDVFVALKDVIPPLTRSPLPRCLPVRQSLSGRLPDVDRLHLRSHLPRHRHRASPRQTLPSMDKWPGRANGQSDQGSDDQVLPLRLDPGAPTTRRRLAIAYNFSKQIKVLKFRKPNDVPARKPPC